MKTKLEVGDKIKETTWLLGTVTVLEVVEIKGRTALAKDAEGYLKFKTTIHEEGSVFLSRSTQSWSNHSGRPTYKYITP